MSELAQISDLIGGRMDIQGSVLINLKFTARFWEDILVGNAFGAKLLTKFKFRSHPILILSKANG